MSNTIGTAANSEPEWSPGSWLSAQSFHTFTTRTPAGAARCRLPAGGRGSSRSPSLLLEVIPIGQGVHVNRCERNQRWPGSLPSSSVPSLCSPRSLLLFLLLPRRLSHDSKKWHINEAPLQGSFLLLSPLKTIRWFASGHGGSHLAQRNRAHYSSVFWIPEAAAATVRLGTPCGARPPGRTHNLETPRRPQSGALAG